MRPPRRGHAVAPASTPRGLSTTTEPRQAVQRYADGSRLKLVVASTARGFAAALQGRRRRRPTTAGAGRRTTARSGDCTGPDSYIGEMEITCYRRNPTTGDRSATPCYFDGVCLALWRGTLAGWTSPWGYHKLVRSNDLGCSGANYPHFIPDTDMARSKVVAHMCSATPSTRVSECKGNPLERPPAFSMTAAERAADRARRARGASLGLGASTSP
jgi:hypothetical protein